MHNQLLIARCPRDRLFLAEFASLFVLVIMSWDIELDDQLLQDLYAWIDTVPLTRPKKHIEKDFSDGGTDDI